ncbi:AAC(3) family N-acetyltransferase [Streptomyces coeruleorubidus]|uniref:AAC(3) family N-acetyltransferase n=1 Tax=Streptomyces coeruleorubidus TaxID=116188 RepID=UPI0033D211E6
MSGVTGDRPTQDSAGHGGGRAPQDGSASPGLGRHVIEPAVFAALARARGGAVGVGLLRAGQLSKRMLMVRALLRSADGRAEAGAAEAFYRGLVELSRRDRALWRRVMLHPYLDEGLARAITALELGEPADLRRLERLTSQPGHEPWHRVRAECDGQLLELRLADRGPFRDVHGHALAPPLTAGQTRRWEETLRAAWEILVRRHPWHAEALASCLTTLVPLLPNPDGTVVSSAARRAFGAVAASLPADPALLALALVHEFLHVQLGALLDLLPLHGPRTDARYHAPWRPDPRPAGALLQGTYAHLGVTDFWRAELAAGTGGARARREYDTWGGHTDAAAGTLLESGELLPAGERFVRELRTAVRREPVLSGRLRGRADLVADLRRLGLRDGDTVLVHAALHAVGPVSGGVRTVVDALLEVLGPAGTLVAYTQTPDNSDPSRWHLTRGYTLPEEDWDQERARMPAFDPHTTRSFGVGVLPEAVRLRPGALRSAHPQSSFAALGAQASYVTSDHALDCHLGEHSPLARLEKLGARVLLLGVGYAACTAFHLAEYRIPGRPRRTYSCVVAAPPPHGRRWHEYRDVALDSGPFAELGAAYEGTGAVRRGRIGSADCRLLDLGAAVDHAVQWLTRGPSVRT